MNKRYAIVDLDGCVSDDRWRRDRIRRPSFVSFDNHDPRSPFFDYHHLSPFDNPAFPGRLADLFDDRQLEIIIITARPVHWKTPTLHWWSTWNEREPTHILMRNNTDLRPSVEVKRDAVRWLPEMYGVPIESIEIAFDDHPEIISMYREIYKLNAILEEIK